MRKIASGSRPDDGRAWMAQSWGHLGAEAGEDGTQQAGIRRPSATRRKGGGRPGGG
eukprot:NODE_3031_length_503_cov_7.103524_g2624_i0.p3 GENE.NODE_3031_length_503_cov_7.103524_g2624_i0~~NODE_3031_length_503_cov_7.103524_g2624_i0.p3  ORF type:complete len:56 (+),score=5.34 NODE_3031_length_503_cov_7.103524_g2624_i0:224-391(+)